MQNSKIESGVQLFSRVNKKSFLEGINPVLFPEGGPLPDQVIEITGDPQIDKNDILIDFIVRCILPSTYNKDWKGSAAILINTEFQISLLKIIKVIEILLKKNKIKDSKKIIIESALRNLIIFNCYNLEELEMTFHYLERVIQCNENINLVVVDNIAAHFWASTLGSQDMMLSYYQHSLKLLEILHNVIRSLQVLLVYVRHERTATKKKNNHRIDFQIQIDRLDQNYIAVVTNFDKESVLHVPFQITPIVEFVQSSIK